MSQHQIGCLQRTREGKSDIYNSSGFLWISSRNLTPPKNGMAWALSSLPVSKSVCGFCQVCERIAWLKVKSSAVVAALRLSRDTKLTLTTMAWRATYSWPSGDYFDPYCCPSRIALLKIVVTRGCLDTEADFLALKKTLKNLWGKSARYHLQISDWAQISVQRLLPLPACLNADGWMVFETVACDEFLWFNSLSSPRCSMQRLACHGHGIATPTCSFV